MNVSPFLTARWLNLAMLNYEIDPAVLGTLVPAGTELDTYRGRTLVSVVGFRFLDTRVRGWKIPLHHDFDEVNLRFYVRREADGELRRGVVFVKEIVPRAAIAWVARRFYNENYHAMPMRHFDRQSGAEHHVGFEWKFGGHWNSLSVNATGEATMYPEESEESFITEHYWGYVRQRDGSTLEYQVEHPAWRVWQVSDAKLNCYVKNLYGTGFVEALSGTPCSAFLAEGSEVTVRDGAKIA